MRKYILLIVITTLFSCLSIDKEKEEIYINRCEEKGPYFDEEEISDPPNSIKPQWRLIDIQGNEKYKFVVGEKIFLDFKIECIYQDYIIMTNKLEFTDNEYFYYEIYNEKGTKIESYPHCYDCNERMYEIPDGSDIGMFFKLTRGDYRGVIRSVFWAEELNKDMKNMCIYCIDFDLWKKGRYKLIGYYRNMDKKKIKDKIRRKELKNHKNIPLQRLWSGKINLRPIEFEIVE